MKTSLLQDRILHSLQGKTATEKRTAIIPWKETNYNERKPIVVLETNDLSKLAVKYCCVQATSKGVFSTTGVIVTATRACLKAENGYF